MTDKDHLQVFTIRNTVIVEPQLLKTTANVQGRHFMDHQCRKALKGKGSQKPMRPDRSREAVQMFDTRGSEEG